MVVRVNTSSSEGSDALTVVDRGYCLSLAWVGRDDCYLVRSALRVVSSVAEKKKRSSVLGGMLFSADKEVHRLLPSEMRLMQCVKEEPRARTLSLSADCAKAFTTAAGDCTLADLFSGPLICLNMSNRKGGSSAVAVRSGGAATGPGDDSASVADVSAHGDGGVLIADLERTEREIRGTARAPKSELLGQFYCLVSCREAARRHAVAAAAIAEKASKDRNSRAAATRGTGSKHAAHSETEDCAIAGDDDQWTLLAVNPAMRAVDAVAWDHDAGRCAVLLGLSRITVFQLAASGDEPTLNSLFCVDLSNIGGSLHSSVTALAWSSDLLCVSTTFGVAAYRVGGPKGEDCSRCAVAHEVVEEGGGEVQQQAWTWGEAAVVVQQGTVYVANGR